ERTPSAPAWARASPSDVAASGAVGYWAVAVSGYGGGKPVGQGAPNVHSRPGPPVPDVPGYTEEARADAAPDDDHPVSPSGPAAYTSSSIGSRRGAVLMAPSTPLAAAAPDHRTGRGVAARAGAADASRIRAVAMNVLSTGRRAMQFTYECQHIRDHAGKNRGMLSGLLVVATAFV